jgi:hypothetical protein
VIVSVSRTSARVLQAGILTALTARLDGVDPAGADQTLRAAGIGIVELGHAWVRIEFLRAAGPVDSGWAAGFAAMISYAETNGWVSGDGSSVRAHLEAG